MKNDPVVTDVHYKIYKMNDKKTVFIDVLEKDDAWCALAYERGASIGNSGSWAHAVIFEKGGFDTKEQAQAYGVETLKNDSVYGGCVDE